MFSSSIYKRFYNQFPARCFCLGIDSDQILRIQITSQFEDRILTGFYTCGVELGELMWRPGLLQQSYTSGKWLILEDLHKANPDVLTVIEHFLSGAFKNCEKDAKIKNGFQLIATCELDYSGNLNPHLRSICSNSNGFQCCYLTAIEDEDLKHVIQERFPDLSHLSVKLMILKTILSSNQKTPFSLHIFVKFCDKINRLTELSAEKVCHLALDYFTAMIPNLPDRLAVAEEIVAVFNFSKENADFLINLYKPEVKTENRMFCIGRSSNFDLCSKQINRNCNYALTRPALLIGEGLLLSVQSDLPVLLCGETGTGKTTLVQFLADKIGAELSVLNMSHQSTSTDLIGGMKPISLNRYFTPIKTKFDDLFVKTFKKDVNEKFLGHVTNAFVKENFPLCLKLILHVAKLVPAHSKMLREWNEFSKELETVTAYVNRQGKSKDTLLFSFVEGCLLQAMRNGDWLLLDEINLASPETLDCLLEVLENRSVAVDESAGKNCVHAHPEFKLFACMNPATDIGKTALPTCVRNHFMEFYFPQTCDSNDLALLAKESLKNSVKVNETHTEAVVSLYVDLIQLAQNGRLYDSEEKVVNFSLRQFSRALRFINKARNCSANKACAEAFKYGFTNQLNAVSKDKVVEKIEKYFPKSDRETWQRTTPNAISIEGFWLEPINVAECFTNEKYVLTPTVKHHLGQLASIVMTGRDPVLLQGETSVGKTSLIYYLAQLLGQKVWRINNHEHTDIQEYLGAYCSSKTGQLVFEDGVLVKAMKNGNWVILDELNLAPSEVLEALNRLLDDNRELYVPETNKLIKAHPQFMLFGTQNPAGSYAGRKVLSRAFRNRFIELNFAQIPEDELKTILSKRCELPTSYATKIIDLMRFLHSQRSLANMFGGKSSFITLRDLFRWANRYANARLSNERSLFDWNLFLAQQGFMLLAGRARNEVDLHCIKNGIEKFFKVELSEEMIFAFPSLEASDVKVPQYLRSLIEVVVETCDKYDIAWTSKLVRMAVLVSNALENKEPVLLVGETGCGKTTICQLLAESLKQTLFTVNCNMNSDASEFIGSLRPVRKHGIVEDHQDLESMAANLFEWQDGPVTQAAKSGGLLLLDEISLADDSVLERLNSLFEDERTLLIAENTQDNKIDVVNVDEAFRVVATMNPSGDYGKKELSIALRNRFTEIWCPAEITREDVLAVVKQLSVQAIPENVQIMCCNFVMTFLHELAISLRDVKSWIQFILASFDRLGSERAYIEGAWLIFLDGLSPQLNQLKQQCIDFLSKQTSYQSFSSVDKIWSPERKGNVLKVADFQIERNLICETLETPYDFDFSVPTTNLNLVKIMRALSIHKPALIEGVPGIGKTALVKSIANLIGFDLVRINLSEQTDISDLLGNDLPNLNIDDDSHDSKDRQIFSWHDGPLLSAINSGKWVLLDEINLASQSVLEGLNALFDHRGEVYIPELDRTFKIASSKTRFFATQNPAESTNGRKNLPRSFLNRFSRIYMDELNQQDYEHIFDSMFSEVSENIKRTFMKLLCENNRINLRDVLRLSSISKKHSREETDLKEILSDEAFLKFIVGSKLTSSLGCESLDKLDNIDVISKVSTSDGTFRIGKFESFKKLALSSPTNFTSLTSVSNLECLESILGCVTSSMPALMSGPNNHKKVQMIKQLGTVTGHDVHVVNLNSCTDVLDLFGKYSNFDKKALILGCRRKIESTMKKFFRSPTTPKKVADKLLMGLICLETCITVELLEKFIQLLQNIQRFSELSFDHEIRDIQNVMKICARESRMNNFVWENSVLIESVQNGHWLILQNVDLCSCAVLDRLNSLLEPGGELTLGELSTNENGEVLTVKPHEDFRVFLTTSKNVDIENSDSVSAAMFNRCILIDCRSNQSDELSLAVSQPEKCLTGFDVYSLKMHSWFNDVRIIKSVLTGTLPNLVNSLNILVDHFPHGLSLEDKMKCWNYLTLKGANEIFEVVSFNDVCDLKNDSTWTFLPPLKENSKIYRQSVAIDVNNSMAIFSAILTRLQKSGRSLLTTDTDISGLAESWSPLKMQDETSERIELTFVKIQKAMKWLQYLCQDNITPHPVTKNDLVLNKLSECVKSLSSEGDKNLALKGSKNLKFLRVSASKEEVQVLKTLFSEKDGLATVVSDEPMETDIAESPETIEIDAKFWLKMISLMACRQVLLNHTSSNKNLSKRVMKFEIPQIVKDLIEEGFKVGCNDFSEIFACLLSWGKLCHCESEMKKTMNQVTEVVRVKELFPEPHLENHSSILNDINQLYHTLWSNSSHLVRTIEAADGIGYAAVKELFRSVQKWMPSNESCDIQSLFHFGCELFSASLKTFRNFDPAEEALIKTQCNTNYVSSCENFSALKINLYNSFLQVSNSAKFVERHPKMILLKQFVEKLKSKTEQLQMLSFPREPSTERYRTLAKMLCDFDKTVLRNGKEVFQVAENMQTQDQILALRNSIFAFFVHLLDLYPDFKDVFYLPVTGLCLVLIGIDENLWKQTCVNEAKYLKLHLYPFKTERENWIEDFLAQSEVFHTSFQQTILVIETISCYWQSNVGTPLRKLKFYISKLFIKLWKKWRENEQKLLEEEEEKASGYIYKEKKEISAESLIHDEPDINTIEGPQFSSDEDRKSLGQNDTEQRSSFNNDNYYQIWKNHDMLTAQLSSADSLKPVEIKCDVIEKFCKLSRADVSNLTQTQDWLENLMLQVSNFHQMFYNNDASRKDNMYNIYTDQNVQETSKCASLLKDLQSRVETLLQEWPEHPDLCGLIKSINRILNSVPVSQTVVYFAVSLEALLSIADSWETVAAKHVSLREQLGPLKQLLIHWRSLELKFWKQSMMYHKQQVYRSVSKFWFNLFAVFIQTMNGKAEIENLIEALFKFLHSSSIGEFEGRLDMLRSWQKFCLFFEKLDLAAIVGNIVSYHEGTLTRIEKSIQAQVDLLKHDLKSFVKVQQWRDFNIFSLKESVHRCKIKIKKVLNSYDEILKQPVTEHLILKDEQLEATLQSVERKLKKMSFSFSDISTHSTDFDIIARASKKFDRKLKILKTKKSFLSEISEQLTSDVTEMDDHVNECHKECRDLEQKLAATKDEDEKKALMSTAKFQMQKRRNLFKQLVDYLNEQGLSFKRSLNSKEEVSDIIRAVPLSSILEFSPSLLNCKDMSLFMAHQYAAFSHMASRQNSELDPRIFQMCSGFIKDSFNQKVEIWNCIGRTLNIWSEVEKVSEFLKSVKVRTRDFNDSAYLHPENVNLTESVKFLSAALDEAAKVSLLLRFVNKLETFEANPESATNLTSIELLKKNLDNLSENRCFLDIVSYSKRGQLINSEHLRVTLKDAQNALLELNAVLSKSLERDLNPFLQTLNCKLSLCLQHFDSFSNQLDTKSYTEISLVESEELAAKIKRVCVKAINVSQKMAEMSLKTVNTDDEKVVTFDEIKLFCKSVKELLISSAIEKDLNRVKQYLNKILYNDKQKLLKLGETENQLALVNNSILYLEMSVKFSLDKFGSAFESISTLITKCNKVFLELILKGFCVPKEFKDAIQSGESKDSGKFEECGIDEGQGVNDVSDKIESEDQLKMEQEQNGEFCT